VIGPAAGERVRFLAPAVEQVVRRVRRRRPRLERLVEPQPHPDMAKRIPTCHAKLTREAGFVDFRRRKPPV
jgi:hypothetical protein